MLMRPGASWRSPQWNYTIRTCCSMSTGLSGKIGLRQKTLTFRCDNEQGLISMCERVAAQRRENPTIVDVVPGYRPQSKGAVERQVSAMKQGFWSIWLDLEPKSSDDNLVMRLDSYPEGECCGKLACFMQRAVSTCGTLTATTAPPQ